MKIILIDLHYFTPVNLIKTLSTASNIIFEQYENYQKMSFRNRCVIAGAEGSITLSIPLQGGRDQKVLFKDLKIDNLQNWQAQHWKSIMSCYNRSPWFEHYREEVLGLFSKKCHFLVDWNLKCFDWTVRALKLGLTYQLSQQYEKVVTDPNVEDWRNRTRPNTPISQEQGIRYRQVFEERTGFIPGLSVLDLIFCEGVNASKKIQN